MRALDEKAIRSSFVNATKGEISRINLPKDLDARAWTEIDMLGWRDPASPSKAHLVVPTPGDGLIGIRLAEAPKQAGVRRARMCSLCTTTHGGDGVALFVAPRAGRAGRDGNTVGLDVCSDLACSAYARGTAKPDNPAVVQETLSVSERIERLQRNVAAFVARVTR